MITPKVSIIVPIYNVASFIERCVRSLMEQTMLDDIEYVFVDDATPDNSIEILQTVIKDYSYRKAQVTILHNEINKGLAASRFVGLDKAKGKYVLNVDSDDWVEPEMVQEMYGKAIAEDADIVCCEAIKERADGSFRYEYKYDEETQENGLLALNFDEIHVAIWNKLIRKDFLINNNIRYYDGINMGEDSALTVRLRYFSKKTVIIHKPYYHYNRMNALSMMACSSNSLNQKVELAKRIEDFFVSKNEQIRFVHAINYYKFMSKQDLMRIDKNIKKWKNIFPECHKDIFRFRNLTFLGRIKWWICANVL